MDRMTFKVEESVGEHENEWEGSEENACRGGWGGGGGGGEAALCIL